MNFSHHLNRNLNRLYKSIAIMLVLFAVLISGFRLLLPYAQNYTQFFTDYINETYQRNIAIGSMSLSWKKQGPTLVAKDISFLETQTVNVNIENIDVRVNFWRSLKEQTLVAHNITLNGIKAVIDQTVEVKSEEKASEQLLLDDTFDLFLNQIRQFSLTNSEIIVRKVKGDRRIVLTHLNWKNEGARHLASGEVKIGDLSANYLKLLMDLTGEKRHEMNGQVYLEAKAIDITPWLDRIFAVKNENTQSNINFDAWFNIQNGITSAVNVALGKNTISWQTPEKEQHLAINSGQLTFEKSVNQGFSLSSSPLDVSFNDHLWHPLSIDLTKHYDGFFTRVSSLNIKGLANLLPLFVENTETRALISSLAPTGTLDELLVEYSDKGLRLSTDFNQVNTNYSKGIPGIKNVSGHALVVDNQVQVEFVATDGALDFDKLFKKPIAYDKISAQIAAELSDHQTEIKVKNLMVTHDELSLSSEINLEIPTEGPASMALLAAVDNANIKNINNFFPHELMGEDLVNYLDRSLVSGNARQAQILFNGPFSSFPFTDHSGIFVVDAELEDSTFSFDENWPSITKFNANLNFTNNSMLITGRSGSLSGLSVSGVEAGIEELEGSSVLTVDAIINRALPESVHRLMLASPLVKTVGATLSKLRVEKPISGDFNLTLPLKDVSTAVASGNVIFDNNIAQLATPSMAFTKINGKLSYRNEVVWADNLSLNWLGLPVQLAVAAGQKENVYQTDLSLKAAWLEQHWLPHIPASLTKYQQGNIHWQGLLSLYNHNDGNFSYQFAAASDLNNMQFDLPRPYNKTLGQTKELTVNVAGDLNRSKIDVKLDKELTFSSVLNHQTVHFDRAHLTLGQESMLLPMKGFHITTDLAHANLLEWQPYVSDILESIKVEGVSDENQHALFSAPKRIHGTIGNVDILGQELNNVSFNFIDQTELWLLQLNANETRSQYKIFPNWLEQGIEVNAEFIHLAKKENLEQSADEIQDEAIDSHADTTAIFEQFPPMTVHCDSCRIANLDLGRVDFSVERVDQTTIKFENFSARRRKAKVNLDMFWRHDESGSSTEVIGDIDVADIETELLRFEFDSIIKDSGIKSNYQASWQAAPYDFTPALFNGEFRAEIDDGYLATVPDTARLFSVLSLESLVRKLTLDFRDIFSDGMFYSSIEGDFKIKDGIFYTDNTEMFGAAGDLVMKGNTNLVDGALDYSLSYKPNLTSSLPALAWIATLQPTLFLAGIAIDQVFTSQVVSEYTFELTGSVEDPDFKEVDRKTEDITVGQSTPPQIIDHSNKDKLDTQAPDIDHNNKEPLDAPIHKNSNDTESQQQAEELSG